MITSRQILAALLVTGTVPVCACRTGNPSDVSQSPKASIPRWKGSQTEVVITSDQIERSHVASAWDAVVLTGMFRTGEDNDGTPTELVSRRGRSSLYLSQADTPLVVVDGAIVSDIESLRDITATSIASIHLLDWQLSTMYYGTNGGAGAIVIRTKTGDVNQDYHQVAGTR
ncbi:MAG TPA: TonB-dependent receptor plug domain-containing protein [Gemmatimonadaceae bacterium]|nr:TonB-dependent receptor plug domain-containing protein [Gemmatimonadaceae bacterium]